MATTAALPACTYSNGSSGVGATLTGNANGALAAQDGITPVANNRILVKDQAAGLQNGIYLVSTLGTAGAPFVLTRALDCDSAAEYTTGAFCFVEEGTSQAANGYNAITTGDYTIGTTAISWSQFSGAGQITAGDGLTKSGNTIAAGAGDGISVSSDAITVALDGGTLAKSGSGLKIADAGVGATQLAAAVAGAGLTGGAGSALAVGAGAGLTVNANDVEVNHAHSGFDVYPKLDGSRAFTGSTVPNASGVDLGSTSARWDMFGADQDFSGATKQAVTLPTANAAYTVLSSDSIVLHQITSGTGRIATLPVAVSGRIIRYKHIGGGAGAITLTPNGAETIDGAASLALNSDDAVMLVGIAGQGWAVF